MSGIGDRLRLAREQAGLTQAQVARLMSLHRPTVSQIESGDRRVTAEELGRFAKIYEVSVSWLSGAEAEDGEGLSDEVRLAARELSKLKKDDLDRVLRVLRSMRAGDRKR